MVVEAGLVSGLHQTTDLCGEPMPVVLDVAGGDCFLRDTIDDLLECEGVSGGVLGLGYLGETLFSFRCEGVPAGFPEVCVTFSFPGWWVVAAKIDRDWEVV